MARLEAYLGLSEADEIALARSAAPPSISADAEILVFGSAGYKRVATGKNGFTCLVERSWNDDFADPEFWNPKIRVPICFNAAASRSVLPVYLERTKWVLAKRSLPQMVTASKAKPAPDPEPGSLAYMLSPKGYVADGVGAPAPHMMIFLARMPASAWGANLPGSPIGATPGDKPSITIFYMPARKWSDGTPYPPKTK